MLLRSMVPMLLGLGLLLSLSSGIARPDLYTFRNSDTRKGAGAPMDSCDYMY